METCNHHGYDIIDDVIHMCTKFHLHACYSYQVRGVKK